MGRCLPDALRRNAPPGMIQRELDRAMKPRTTWDLPHEFFVLHWDGRKMTTGAHMMITHDVDPLTHPDLMAKGCEETIKQQSALINKGILPTLYAFAFITESHLVRHDPRASTGFETRRVMQDSRERRLNSRPDAIDATIAYCVDIEGRGWVTTRRSDAPKRLHRASYGDVTAPTQAEADRYGFQQGPFIQRLYVLAKSTALVIHADPAAPAAIDALTHAAAAIGGGPNVADGAALYGRRVHVPAGAAGTVVPLAPRRTSGGSSG